MLRILHITNDYSGSKVYKNLVLHLDKLGIEQIVYCPIKNQNSINKNIINLEVTESKIIYSHILNKLIDRVFFKYKITKILKDIESKVDLSKIDLIHSHTWYTDGGVAYLLNRKYDIPFITTIRNTDLNIFYKFLFFERKFGLNILKKAKKIILISHSYIVRLKSELPLIFYENQIIEKIQVLPNGVDDFWIHNFEIKKSFKINSPVNCLFVGRFLGLKNVISLQKAIIKLSQMGIKVHLHLVGGEGDHYNKVLKLLALNKNIMFYHGEIYDLNRLKSVMNKMDIFAMPSRRETFGLVYIEALLQGLPILYTKGEGIDGTYEEKIGERVSKNGEVNEIVTKILKMINNYESYHIPTEKIAVNHNWKNISRGYLLIYNEII
jgi:glycosyltransferase involved in cell wall biosynthesis